MRYEVKSLKIFLLHTLYVFLFWKKACTINDFAFGGGNILVSGSHNLQDNWEACQASCQVNLNPVYSWNDYCILGTSKNQISPHFSRPLPIVVSGPGSNLIILEAVKNTVSWSMKMVEFHLMALFLDHATVNLKNVKEIETNKETSLLLTARLGDFK